MALYRRSKVWHAYFCTPSGKRVRVSTKTKDRVKAQEFHDTLKAKYWRVEKMGEKQPRTWEECAVAYLQETTHRSTHEKIKEHVRKLQTYLKGYNLDEITRDVIDNIKDQRLKDGVSSSTVNRMLEILRAMLRSAVEREWIDKVPRVRMLPEPKHRPRWLTREEAGRLLAELPEHLASMVRFSLATGLRQRNVTELEWNQVDLDRQCAWIYADQSKSGHDIAVPLNSEAVAVLCEQLGKHPIRVFTYKGRPISRVNNHAWRKALKRAGIGDFTWHNLRSTWASWHAMSGTSPYDLQHLGAWQSAKMVQRYAALSAEHLSEAAERVTNLSQRAV